MFFYLEILVKFIFFLGKWKYKRGLIFFFLILLDYLSFLGRVVLVFFYFGILWRKGMGSGCISGLLGIRRCLV